MKKVVVFGGSGFLGRPVVSELYQAGYQVIIFDQNAPAETIPHHQLIQGDILDPWQVERACRGAEYVYNFAGLADINEAKDRPLATVQLNIAGNVNILEACRKAEVKRFVYASSLYVYSESGSFYRASKQASERYVELYYQQYGLSYTILRYGSLYGSGADQRNNIYRLIKEALVEGRMTYPGTGEELREYIHINDAAKASVQVLGSEFENQHIVLTGHQPLKIKDLVKMIAEILGRDIRICFNVGDHAHHYSITPYTYKPKLAKKLVVNPFVDMGQGILECIHEISSEVKYPIAPLEVVSTTFEL